MANVRIPSQLRDLVDGNKKLTVEAQSISTLIHEIDMMHPGFKKRIVDDTGDISSFVGIYVEGEDIRFLEGIDTELQPSSEVSIVPAAAGGAKLTLEIRN
tara:strand:- start:4163 stop:4462 length:300 start_codon:yes stop_codon:yes gene_type:complete